MGDREQPPTHDDGRGIGQYRGLDRLLHYVRWSQHLLAIIAEVLILISFAMSGMDVSLGGVMASVPWLKVLWAAMFALGIDTAFALSWVHVRQCVNNQQWWSLAWNMILALSMSFIIFQPISVQLMQQTLDVSFNQAVASLGINIVFLTYARSGVAVFLGAILAMTNVESDIVGQRVPVGTQPKRQFILIDQLFQKVEAATDNGQTIDSDDTATIQPALVIENDEQAAQEPVATPVEPEAPAELSATTEEAAPEQIVASEQPAEVPAQPELPRYDTPEQRAQKVSEVDFTDLSACERVVRVLELLPDLSDRELGKLSGMAAATAKKHREMLKPATASTPPNQAQVIEDAVDEQG